MKTSQTLLLIFLGMILGSGAWAEYRAYELEVFDRTTKTAETIITSFSPADYILTPVSYTHLPLPTIYSV